MCKLYFLLIQFPYSMPKNISEISFQEEMINFSNEFHKLDSKQTLKTIVSNLSHCLGKVPSDTKWCYKNCIDYFKLLYNETFDVESQGIEFWDVSLKTKAVFKTHQNLFGCNVVKFVIAYIDYKNKRILENKEKNKGIKRLYG